MDSLITLYKNNGTKILAGIIGVLGIIQASSDIVPASWGKYITLIVAILVYVRGQANTQAIATAVTQQHMDAMVKAVASGTPIVTAAAGKLATTPKSTP